MAEKTLSGQLSGLQKLEKKIAFQKEALLNKALQSANPNDLMKAQSMIAEIENKPQSDRKSFLVDPNDWQSFAGFKQKPIALTYAVLRRISYALPIVRAVINTRIDQIATFCEPQSDRYSTGFVIRKKQGYFDSGTPGQKMTKAEHADVNKITDILLNCGVTQAWGEDDFDSFTRKFFNDSLTFDQGNFEIVGNNKGGVFEFLAVDAASIRLADTMDQDFFIQGDRKLRGDDWQARNRLEPTQKQRIKGYLPAYCQIYDNIVINDYYPWEMAFCIRNPTTNIYGNGYGVSEIEILINTVTSMLWAEEYNRKFFSQGSAPKGFIKIKSGTGAGSEKVSEFKRMWQAMMSGVGGSHKTPILEGDVDWVDLQKTNRDMEFSAWFEFLIKVACAIYRIDPAEVNFPLSGGSEQKAMFEGNNEARLKHSKDKGLRPLIKFYQRKLNKYVINRINPAYELVFVGLENDDPTTDIDRDTKMAASFMTVDEIRLRRGLEPLGEEGGGNVIENAVWMQNKMGAQQMAMQQQQGGDQGDGQDYYGNGGEDPNGVGGEQEAIEQEDPFGKALQGYWDNLNKSE
jgi:hypothetical protein